VNRPGTPDAAGSRRRVLDHEANAALRDFLRPAEMSLAVLRERLTRARRGRPPSESGLERFWSKLQSLPPEAAMESAPFPPGDAAEIGQRLGTHPALVETLMQLNRRLPADCLWVIERRPALVHPATGVAFAFAVGTIGCALRFAEPALSQARAAGAGQRARTLDDPAHDLVPLGPAWVYAVRDRREAAWCRAAYAAAGAM
jgi:hypothetical protein